MNHSDANIPARLFFVGAGGIGMANLVRYYLGMHSRVAGYDRTQTALTDALEKEGALMIYDDDAALITSEFKNPEETLVVYTPAIPENNNILSYFRNNGFTTIKRAALLGKITSHSDGICVAGSHGKTTTSSMIANILRQTPAGCNAFLGGILRNTGSNFILDTQSRLAVIEADEYDRSFHHLTPLTAVVTSTDPDHLDIYGNEENYLESFAHFTSLIRPEGSLILHTGLKLKPRVKPGVRIITYAANDSDADWHADNVRFGFGTLSFDIVTPEGRIDDVSLGAPLEINIDNAVAAAAAARLSGASDDEIRNGLSSFLGAKRRFELHLRPDDTESGTVLIDDYAHSPNEVKASIASVRKLFPGKKVSVIFQPHLYTRTRDFAHEFAAALSTADEVIMPEIYPARELPIPGVTSHLILDEVAAPQKLYCERKDLLTEIKNRNFEILMTLGAADIDRMIPDMVEILRSKRTPHA